MKLHTCQISSWRKAQGEFVDITIKSGIKAFAPSWELLRAYKDGSMGCSEYKIAYTALMRESWAKNKDVWDSLVKQEEVTIACYCASGEFCHRLCLRDMLEAICKSKGIEFTYAGEIV